MPRVDLDKLLESLDPSRRSFMKTLIIGSAYASPMMTSFGMEENQRGDSDLPIETLCSNLGTNDPDFLDTADVIVNKTASPDPVGPGEQLTFTLEVFNCGPAMGVNVVVSDQLPAGATYVSSNRVNAIAMSFDLVEPSVGSEGETWQAVATTDFPAGDVAIFEIVVEVSP